MIDTTSSTSAPGDSPGDSPGDVPTAAPAGGVTFSLVSPVILIGPDEQNALSLVMTNTSGSAMQLPGGAPASELSIGSTPAALYLTLGSLLDATAFSDLEITAPGWVSQYFDDDVANWGLFPSADATLAPGASITFTIANIVVGGQPSPGSLTVDYYNLGSLDSDSWQMAVLAQNPPRGLRDLDLLVEFGYRSSVDITLSGGPAIANTLMLSLSNPSPTDPIVPAGTPPGPSPPVFNLSFVYGDAPGYWALCTPVQGASIVVALGDVPVDAWSVIPNMEDQNPYWILSPQAPEILGVGDNATVTFEISGIVTALDAGVTLMYVQYANIPGYNDGFVTLPILKQIPDPTILTFGINDDVSAVDWGAPFTLEWTTAGSDFCLMMIDGVGTPVPLGGSMTDSIEGPARTYQLVCGTGDPDNPTVETPPRTIRVPVNPPQITAFDVSASTVVWQTPVTVTWSTTSAGTCALLFNGSVVSNDPSGTYTAVISADSTFTLEVTGNGSATGTQPVTVGTATILSFTEQVNADGSSTFNWSEAFSDGVGISSFNFTTGRFTTMYLSSATDPLTAATTSGSFVGPSSSAGLMYFMICLGSAGVIHAFPTLVTDQR